MIRCPACHNVADNTRYYDLKDIDMEWETGCRSCDCTFLPDIRDVMFLYEKI